MTESITPPGVTAPGLIRRLLAMAYDCLLLIALFAVMSLPIVMLAGEDGMQQPLVRNLHRAVLLATTLVFFGWFWTHGGQTLGMRAWRLRLVTAGGDPVDWPTAIRRWLAACLSLACLGLGYWWIAVDRDRLSWHDRLSNTRLQLLPKM